MNRRTAIRKAFGVGAAAVSLPVLAKVVEASQHNNMLCGVPTGCAPEAPAPSPPDTRTPEQVIADTDKEIVKDAIQHLTRPHSEWSRRWAHSLYPREFGMVLASARAQELSIEERQVDGHHCIIGPNGNVIRQLFQIVHLV